MAEVRSQVAGGRSQEENTASPATRDLQPATPIEDYAIIGDTHSIALISRGGSLDWLCWPRFDSSSLFARIVDLDRGGHFSIRPAGEFDVRRRYDTNVLITTFTTSTGVARLTDLMPVMREIEKKSRLSPFRNILRRVECIEGEVAIEVEYAPRLDYARTVPKLEVRRDIVSTVDGPAVLHLRSDAQFTIDDGIARSRFTLASGERRDFALSFDSHAPAVYPHIRDEASAQIECTIDFWRQWIGKLRYDGPYRDAVERSVFALKLMTYAPSGAIVAAPTTSLPEAIGGIRNWDYRYCWLRDAAFTVAALNDLGFNVESGAFVNWLLYATRLTHPSLQILYDVFGEARLPERTLDHLAGYRGSRPVRIGNDARGQFQLDIYAEVLGAAEEHFNDEPETEMPHDARKMLTRLADIVVKRWREPDSGIWEKRSGRKQHVHAKVMAWAALDTANRLLGKNKTWSREQEEIKRVVLERGFNAALNSFVGELDGNETDAALLQIARVGFLDDDDPRLLGTIAAIRKTLGRNELVYRYSFGTDDGLPPGEGAFLPCSFWLVEALAISGREAEARDVFEKLIARANDVGLFSEEMDVGSGAFLGNFPQALTHIGLVNAAISLSEEGKTRRESRRKSRGQ
jgi:GH15 family glucan-1,4-alpha-glucosidase